MKRAIMLKTKCPMSLWEKAEVSSVWYRPALMLSVESRKLLSMNRMSFVSLVALAHCHVAKTAVFRPMRAQATDLAER